MSFIYVRTHADGTGTATGDQGLYASKQTGDWDTTFSATSQYYATVALALSATSIASGDTIICSDIHSETTTSAITIGLTSSDKMRFYSADDTAMEDYLPGASVACTSSSNDITFTGYVYSAGINYAVTDDITFSTVPVCVIQDSTITLNGTTNDYIISSTDGNRVYLHNVDITTSSSTEIISINNNTYLEWIGGSLVAGATAKIFNNTSWQNGGATVYFKGVDLTNNSFTLVVANSDASTDTVLIRLEHCPLHASFTKYSGTVDAGMRVEYYQCDDPTSDRLFSYHIEDNSGTLIENTTTYWTAGTAMYEGSDKMSFQITTETRTSEIEPFIVDIPVQYADLSQAASDTIRIHLTCDSTLNDTDVGVVLMYADGTTAVQANFAGSFPAATGSAFRDPLNTGTGLTTTSGEWTSGKTNTYKIEVSTTGDAGQACAPFVRLMFMADIANDIFISSEVEFV